MSNSTIINRQAKFVLFYTIGAAISTKLALSINKMESDNTAFILRNPSPIVCLSVKFSIIASACSEPPMCKSLQSLFSWARETVSKPEGDPAESTPQEPEQPEQSESKENNTQLNILAHNDEHMEQPEDPTDDLPAVDNDFSEDLPTTFHHRVHLKKPILNFLRFGCMLISLCYNDQP